MASKLKHLSFSAAAAALLAGGSLWFPFASHDRVVAQEPSGRPEVEVNAAQSENVLEWKSFSGRIEAVEQVDVRPLVSGAITAVRFSDGDLVKKGDPLFQIDPTAYQAELDRALGERDAAQNTAVFAHTDLDRAQRLISTGGISARERDQRAQQAREADAKLEIANAAVDAAQINLDSTTIRAPISGRVSRAELTVGNVVQPGEASPALTRLVSVAEVYAAFDADEQSYLGFLRSGKSASNEVELGLADEQGYPRRGKISSVDNRMDIASGTIRVRAIFDNTDGTLIPGLYARVRIPAGKPQSVILVPSKSIGTDQDKKFVLVVDEANKIDYRTVFLGAEEGTRRVITAGLAAGDRVVVNGGQAVRPGQEVDVVQSVGDNK